MYCVWMVPNVSSARFPADSQYSYAYNIDPLSLDAPRLQETWTAMTVKNCCAAPATPNWPLLHVAIKPSFYEANTGLIPWPAL